MVPTPDSDSWSGQKKPSARELDLNHVATPHWKLFRTLFHQFDDMWEGKMSQINTVIHQIHLKQGALPSFQRTYPSGHRAGKFATKEIDRMMEAKVIEPAQSK